MKRFGLIFFCFVLMSSLCRASDGEDLKFWQERASHVKAGMLRSKVEHLFSPIYSPPRNDAVFKNSYWFTSAKIPEEVCNGEHSDVMYWVARKVTVTIDYGWVGGSREGPQPWAGGYTRVNSILVEQRSLIIAPHVKK
jgi:hypothetical protein